LLKPKRRNTPKMLARGLFVAAALLAATVRFAAPAL